MKIEWKPCFLIDVLWGNHLLMRSCSAFLDDSFNKAHLQPCSRCMLFVNLIVQTTCSANKRVYSPGRISQPENMLGVRFDLFFMPWCVNTKYRISCPLHTWFEIQSSQWKTRLGLHSSVKFNAFSNFAISHWKLPLVIKLFSWSGSLTRAGYS